MVPSNVYNLQHTLKVSKMERIKMTCDKQNMIPLFKRRPIDQCCCSGSLEFIVAQISVWLRGCLSPRINFRELNDPVLISPQQRAYFTMIVGIGAWKPLQLKPVVFRKSSLICNCPVAGVLHTTRQSTMHLNPAAGMTISKVGMFIWLFT